MYCLPFLSFQKQADKKHNSKKDVFFLDIYIKVFQQQQK